jgi:hypothetical protein
MKHRNSHLLIGYWSRLGCNRQIPDQTDIDPRAIKRMLPNVFILDAEDPERPTYRLAGTLLCERFGQELRGTRFLGHWETRAIDTLQSLVRRALTARQAVCLSAIGTTSQCATMEMETILAPLTFGAGPPRRFLGITQFLGDAGSLAGQPITCERLISSAAIREGEPSSPPTEPPSSAPILSGARRMAPKTPHLRLVVSQAKPAAVHGGAGDAMGKLITALDIAPAIRLVR